jgi:hypothetical protein
MTRVLPDAESPRRDQERRRPRWSILIRHQNMAVVRLLLSGWNARRSRGVTWKPKRFEQSATTVVGLGIEAVLAQRHEKFALRHLSLTADGLHP